MQMVDQFYLQINNMQTTEQLQAEILSIRKQLGWSNSRLAEVIAADDEANEVDIEKFTEKLKKHLQRQTTPVELLLSYLQIIKNHPDFKRTNRIFANPIRLDAVDIGVLHAVQSFAAEAQLRDECE